MNIEKLARHLKEFTLDEIEMIAECDCKNELEHLLNRNKIVFEQGVFKIVEVEPQINYGIFENNVINDNYITVLKSTNYFLKNHVSKFCKQSTYRNYECIFRFEINPFFRRKYLNNIEIKDVKEFYKSCVNRGLSPRRIKNILALLNQLLKYSEENLGIKRKCVFQVKRITEKNEFNLG